MIFIKQSEISLIKLEILVNWIRDICICPYLDCTLNDYCSLARQTPHHLRLDVISTRFNWCVEKIIFSWKWDHRRPLVFKIRNIFSQGKSEGFDSCDQPSNLTQIGFKSSLKNRASLLYYIKLCASFQIHWWIQTGVTVWKRSIRVKIGVSCPMWHKNFIDDLEKQ